MPFPGCQRGSGSDATTSPALPSGPGGPLALTLVSFNVRYEGPDDRDWRAWPQRVAPVVREIRRMNPDVFGIQEALHGQAADIRASLPDYEFHGIGRDDGDRDGEYSALFWKREKFAADPADRGTFWLSDTPERPGSKTWGNDTVRVCAWQRLIDRVTGRGFYVFNTHFDHRHQGSRERSAQLVAQRIAARRHAGESVILLGDFNANEDNPALRHLTDKSRPDSLLDTFAAIHGKPANRRTLHFWSGRHDSAVKVDHILVSRDTKVRSAAIVYPPDRGGPLPSDHFPVRAEIVLR